MVGPRDHPTSLDASILGRHSAQPARFQVEVGFSGVEIQVSKQIDVLPGDGADHLDQVQRRHVAGRLVLLVDTRQEGRIVVDNGIDKES